jgi:hypothetical protein
MPDNIYPDDPNGTDWVRLGRWLETWYAATTTAPVPTGDPLLTPIRSDDTEGTKFAKWQRWLKAIQQAS